MSWGTGVEPTPYPGNFHLLIWLYIVLKATFILLFTAYFAFIITYFPFYDHLMFSRIIENLGDVRAELAWKH